MAEHITILRDPGALLALDDVLAPDRDGQFLRPTTREPGFGPTPDAAWVRVQLRNSAPDPKDVVLNLELPPASFVDFYGPVTDGVATEVIRTGARMPYSSRPIEGRTFAFPIHLDGGAESVYYLRVLTNFTLRLPLTLWPAASFAANAVQEEIAWAVIVGLILLLAIYNLLVFAVVRDRDHLLLALAIVVSTVVTLLSSGYASRWLGGWSTYFPQILVALIALAAIVYIVFVISFLQLRQRARWAFRSLLVIATVVFVAGIIGLVLDVRLSYLILIASTTAMLAVILLATIVETRQGYRPAVYFLIAQLLPIALGLTQSISLLGVAPWAPPYVGDLPTTELLLIVLMSLAMADRINTVRKEVERANRALAASEARILDYLNALPFFVQVHDRNLDLIFSNRTLLQGASLVGPPRIDENYRATKDRYPVLVYGSDKPYPDEQLPLMRAARGESAHADDLLVNFPDGDHILEAWSVPISDASGAIAAIVTAFQNITERRAIESELASYREHLEQRVRQRTAELAAANDALNARITELSAISEIGQIVAQRTDPQPAFQRVAQILTELYDVSLACIALLRPEIEGFQVISLSDRRRPDFDPSTVPHIPYAAADDALASLREPIVISDAAWLQRAAVSIRGSLGSIVFNELLLAPLLSRQEVFGIVAVASIDSDRLFDASARGIAQTIATQVAAALEVSRLFSEEQAQRHMADALRETASILSRSLDEDTVLATVLEQLRQVLDYEGAAISLVVDGELVLTVTEGLSRQYLGRRIPLESRTASAVVLQSGEPLLIDDTRQSHVWEPWASTDETRSWLGVPLVVSGRPIGVLTLDSTRVGAFHQQEADLLLTFANQAAIAVANARLYRQAQAAAAASERERIARDLHDAVTQSIFSASLIAEALPVQLPDADPAVQTNLESLAKLTRGALAELRALLLELRPEHLTATPLDQLLNQLAQAFTGRMGTPVTVSATCEPHYKPPAPVQIVVYRIAQEALNNVARHAYAQNVTMSLVMRTGFIHLGILDDGRGFDMHTRAQERLGISIMVDRAAEIGAKLTIDSAPGMGTQIFLIWNERSD